MILDHPPKGTITQIADMKGWETSVTNYICTLKYLSQAKGCYSKYKWVRDRFLPEMKKIYTKGLSLKYKLIRSVTISSYFNALIYIAIKAKRL